MDGMNETHFYHEDTLPVPVASPVIYNKDLLQLNIADDHRRLRRNNIQGDMNSPDFNILKLASPDLERMLLAFQSSTTENSPGGGADPSSNTVTTPEHMDGSKGLAQALQELHDSQEMQDVNIVPQLIPRGAEYVESTPSEQFYLTRDASGAITVTNTREGPQQEATFATAAPEKQSYLVQPQYQQNSFMTGGAPAQIYPAPLLQPVDDLDTAAQIRALTAYNNVLAAQNGGFPSQVYKLDPAGSMFAENSSLEPIDLEVQELVKRERKKQRNRVASSKCRKRKLEKEAVMEVTVKEMRARNVELSATANNLKQQICELKQRVMDHVTEGCPITLQHLNDPSMLFEAGEWSLIPART